MKVERKDLRKLKSVALELRILESKYSALTAKTREYIEVRYAENEHLPQGYAPFSRFASLISEVINNLKSAR